MIYSSEADLVPFLKGLVKSLFPYAKANEVDLKYVSDIKKQVLMYQPFLLSQSLIQLVCNIINLLPPKSKIEVRILYSIDNQSLHIEIENSNLNLIRVNEVTSRTIYSFEGCPLLNGTQYNMVIPLHHNIFNPDPELQINKNTDNLPQFYKEVQKRLRSHFTQTEKLIASLEQNRPKEAAFMQRINALIRVNMENENFDTDALCKAMSLSRTQLFRRLKSLIQQAPANYIKIIRLQRAKELLETTDLTVGEVVFRTGFQTLSHFTNIFQKQYGILPSVFRRSNNSATNG